MSLKQKRVHSSSEQLNFHYRHDCSANFVRFVVHHVTVGCQQLAAGRFEEKEGVFGEETSEEAEEG